jgi:glycosyltransferase involved in cell wall biosynthesis
VGAASPNKNLERLLKSINILMSSNDFDHSMVFAGKLGWGYYKLRSKAHELGIGEKVRMLGYVPDQDLPALYSAGSLFVFPSLYEGFGMPVLEAMACGTPVACSNTGALKEVADDAAILFNPEVPEEIAEAIHRILSNDSLNANLIRKGLMRSDSFRWDPVARQIISIYKEIC